MTSMRWYRLHTLAGIPFAALLRVSSVSSDVENHELLIVDLGQGSSFLQRSIEWLDTIDMEDLHGTHVGMLACDVVLVLGEHYVWIFVWCGKLARKEILVGPLKVV